MIEFQTFAKEYFQQKQDIFLKSFNKTKVYQHLCRVSKLGKLTEAECEGSKKIAYVKEMAPGRGVRAGEDIGASQRLFMENKMSWDSQIYTSPLMMTKAEFEMLKSMASEKDARTFLDSKTGAFEDIAESVLHAMDIDLQDQKAAGAVGVDSLELMAEQGVYNGFDGATEEWWRGQALTVTGAVGDLLKLVTEDSINTVFMDRMEEFKEMFSDAGGTLRLALCGANVWEIVKRSLKVKGQSSYSFTADAKDHDGITYIKATHKNWADKKNKMIGIGENALEILDYADQLTPKGEADFEKIDNMVNTWRATPWYGVLMAVRNRRHLGTFTLGGVDAKQKI